MPKKIRLRVLKEIPEGETVVVCGVVVQKFVGDGYTRFIIDDFTGVTAATAFDMDVGDIEIGDNVKIVGVVREREGEKVLIIKGIRKISIYEELVHRLEAEVEQSEELVEVETLDLGGGNAGVRGTA